MIGTYKLAKIFSFITKDHYLLLLLNTVTENNRAWRNVYNKKYNAPLKETEVRDDGNIELLKIRNYYYQSIIQ